MIQKALEVLEMSPHGQQLVNFVEKKQIKIELIATPKPVTYLPEEKLVYIGFNKNNPISPSYFILMMVGIIREAQQEAAGITHPPSEAPAEEHRKTSIAKYQDTIWYMCTVALELNDQKMFAEYKFLDELGKMGYSKALDMYIKQERS